MRVMPGGILPHPRDEAEERPLPSRAPLAQHAVGLDRLEGILLHQKV